MLSFLPLLLAASSGVSIQPIDGERYRLTVTYRGQGYEGPTRALLKLAATAERLCKGKGRPVSGDSIELNEVRTKSGRKGGGNSLTQEWRCVPPSR